MRAVIDRAYSEKETVLLNSRPASAQITGVEPPSIGITAPVT